MDKEVVIYTERLRASQAQIADFIDHKLVMLDASDTNYPKLGFFIMSYVLGREPFPEEAEREWQKELESPRPNTLYLKKYWYTNRWIILAALPSSGIVSSTQYESGYVELKSVHPDVEGLTDVAIVSKWPVMRSYWEWVAKRIRYEFLKWESAADSLPLPVSSAGEIPTEPTGKFSPPPDDFGRGFYESYSQPLAERFIEALAEAYTAYTKSRKSLWSPKFISTFAGLSPQRTGQIINAFRDWAAQKGWPQTINGVPLPPDKRQGQGRKSRKTP